GWALGQAGLKTKSRKGLAALILGANAPDIDVFFQWAPWEPLATHRGFTHSLVGGFLILPLILWGLLLARDRWQVRRGVTFESGLEMNRRWLLALCYLGALTHPLLDLQTTYSVQLLSPFSGAWYHSDSLFIIDVWLWTLLAGSIAWSRWREKKSNEWTRPVQGALLAAVAYFAFNLGLTGTAREALLRRAPNATYIFASPQPVLFWRRTMVWREGAMIGGAEFDPLGGNLGPSAQLRPDGMDGPLVRRAIAVNSRLRKFLYWSILPVATVALNGCETTVYIGDARYGPDGGRRSRLYREGALPTC
ncbi:MAG: metal-dependent hydrolase, partial [Sphingomicrobium sp.]